MRELTVGEALHEALSEEMSRDDSIFVMGEDVELGYITPVTKGLIDKFGPERVRNTPISESAIIGSAIGAALNGMRPVVELQFCDLIPSCMDAVVNQAAKLRYMSGGQVKIPIVIRAQVGLWNAFGPQHSQSLQAWFMHIPGLKVVMPATPADAKGLLKSAIRDDNPVLFFEHKQLWREKGPVPDGEYLTPFGKAAVHRDGTDITVVATSWMVRKSLTVAEELAKEGISVMVVDPRTLSPMDRAGIIEAVKKTNRAVVVDEGHRTGGVAGEIVALIAEEAMDWLDAPPKRVAALDSPIPVSPPLERYVIPDEGRIKQAILEVLGRKAARAA